MAITQISKIQVRTGNSANLPTLDSGEFGYATDTNQLYIGNPGATLPTDNTQVLTLPATVTPATDTTIAYKVPVEINGTTYYIALTASP